MHTHAYIYIYIYSIYTYMYITVANGTFYGMLDGFLWDVLFDVQTCSKRYDLMPRTA